MITKYKYNASLPFVLHDMTVNKIEYSEGNLHLEFEHGFRMAQEPYPQVDGNITIEDIDEDFSCVLLLSKLGQYGEFRGEKLSIKDFLSKYKDVYFEIVDEMYGYNQVEYSGYLSLPENEYQIQTAVSLYFTGNIVYEVTEKEESIKAKIEELNKV